jgi:hypothetical protein
MRFLRRAQSFSKRYAAVLSLFVIAFGGLWTAFIYVDTRLAAIVKDSKAQVKEAIQQQKQEMRDQQRLLFDVRKEFQKPFYERQMSLCLEASNAAAVLATTQDLGKASAASDTFWRLYWGQLVAVEEKEADSTSELVERMVEYGTMLKAKCKDLPCSPQVQGCRSTCPAKNDEQEPACLQCASLNLARACRHLISEAWQLIPPTKQ